MRLTPAPSPCRSASLASGRLSSTTCVPDSRCNCFLHHHGIVEKTTETVRVCSRNSRSLIAMPCPGKILCDWPRGKGAGSLFSDAVVAHYGVPQGNRTAQAHETHNLQLLESSSPADPACPGQRYAGIGPWTDMNRRALATRITGVSAPWQATRFASTIWAPSAASTAVDDGPTSNRGLGAPRYGFRRRRLSCESECQYE